MKRDSWIGLAAVLVAAAYAFARLRIGWIAGDDGALAQSALRVFQGQLPHRDFVEAYTGGLSLYHAMAFHVFGVKLVAMRYAAFAIFVPWVAAVYFIVRRFASPIGAAGVAVLCATWSLPVFPVPMPSWYNLFLATFGAAAILHYLDTHARRWLFVAGLCGGLSIVVKIIGLYYIAAVLLWFVYREQDISARADAGLASARGSKVRLYPLFVTAGLVAFVMAMGRLIHNQSGSAELFHFFVPGAALAALLLYREWTLRRGADGARFGVLFEMAAPFVLGLSVPVLAVMWPYWRTASLRVLLDGVFVRGSSTIAALAIEEPLGIGYALFALPLMVILAAAMSGKEARSWGGRVLIVATMALVLVWVGSNYFAGLFIWLSVATLAPLVVIAGMLLLAGRRDSPDESSLLRDQRLFLTLALAAMCSLVQFPYPAPIYFHYAAPLVILAVVALVSTRRRTPTSFLLGATVAFYVLFAAIFLASPNLYRRTADTAQEPLRPLDVRRGEGLWIRQPAAFMELARTVDEHAGRGPILAFPECADVYFLSERESASRNDISPTPAEIHKIIEEERVRVVVVKMGLVFPGSVPPVELVREISARFPHSERVGEYFVHWR